MIRIKEKEGKQYIYQYDTGREVIITPEDGYSVDSIEYFNNTTDLAPLGIIREVDGVLLSEIPNSLLQSDNTIQVYLVMHDGNMRQTVEYKDITVIPRAKPADYVDEPDKVLTWHELDERLKKLEETPIDNEAVAEAVSEYLAENPIQIKVPDELSELKDDSNHRTVTDKEKEAWNGKLDSSKLPDAINTALAQAKESGEFKGDKGYTPKKGIDYFTEADKTAFVTDVLNALPTWNGGAY